MTDTQSHRPPRFRLYIDESGDHSYGRLDDPPYRYLALVGVWFRQDKPYVDFADRLAAFKRDIFGPRPDKPVHLHRHHVINRKGPFGLLRDDAVRERFDDGLVELARAAEFRLVCVVIDKKAHLEKYADPFHPYHYCLAALLDRYCGWLNYKNGVGDVMAEARGKTEDRQLRQAYQRVHESGTLMFPYPFQARVLTSKELKLRSKTADIAGLQLADILAYPVKQAMLAEKRLIPRPGDVFGRRLHHAVAGKFNRNEWRGQVTGYGKVWL